MNRTEPIQRAGAVLTVAALAVAAAAASAEPVPPGAGSQASASQPAAAASQPAARAPRVRIEQLRSVRLQGQQAQLDLVLRVSNPGGWKVSLDDIRFHVRFNGTATASGHSTGELDLPAHGSADVPVRVDIDGAALLAVLAALPPDGLVRYELQGSAELDHTLLRLPFTDQGSVVLRLQ